MRLLVLLLMMLPAAALANSTRATFDVYVGGIKAATLAVAGEERDGRYAVAGVMESAGVVGAFRHVRYDASARGQVAGGDLGPRRYSETLRNGGRTVEKSMTWRGGVPLLRGGGKRDDDDLDPAAQVGTVDPLSAIWGVLRDVPEQRACGFSADIFDGARRARVRLGAPERRGREIVCGGEYRRIAGYDDEELADPSFPFRLTYRQGGDGRWQVARIDMKTILGPGAMVRRR